jgi:hypothetical protein
VIDESSLERLSNRLWRIRLPRENRLNPNWCQVQTHINYYFYTD